VKLNMHRITRAALVPALILILAACAGPRTGAGGSAGSSGLPDASGSSQPASSLGSSPSASGSETGGRVDIGVLTADPGSYEGQDVRVLARVDEVLVDGTAFLTSPSASDEGQIAVVLRPDAQVDKQPVAGSVVWVDGTVMGFTADDLQAAGVDVTPDQLSGFSGEWVIVASAIGDPLGSQD
jgi:hypothetical protein